MKMGQRDFIQFVLLFYCCWLCIKIYLQIQLALIGFKEIKGYVILFNIHLAAYNVILLQL